MEQNKLDKIIVHQIENEEVAKSVLKIAEKHGAKWPDGSSPNKRTYFVHYGKRTAYHFNNNILFYSSTDHALTMEDCLNYRFMTALEFIKEFGEKKEEPEYELLPFNIEKAKAGAKVVTRDRREVRILAYDLKGDNPICGAIKDSDIEEFPFIFDKNGVPNFASLRGTFDLFMKVPKRKRKTLNKWVNVYKDTKGEYFTSCFHNSKEEAYNNRTLGYIDTVSITYEVKE